MKGCINPSKKLYKKLDLLTEYKLFASVGLVPDFDNEIFILEGYGAYMGSYNEKSLKKYLKKNYQELLDEGYEIIDGPVVPLKESDNNSKGLYLINYEKFLKNENKLKLK